MATEVAGPPPVNGADGDVQMDGVPAPEPQEKATETLYIQNLNEKVKLPGLPQRLLLLHTRN